MLTFILIVLGLLAFLAFIAIWAAVDAYADAELYKAHHLGKDDE